MIDTGGAGTVAEFEEDLKEIGNVDVINLFITSEGGDVGAGIAIHNILARQSARIVCTIDGYAYSIATVIAMAADEVRMAPNGLMMIHDAEWSGCYCDLEGLQQAIKVIEACNSSMVAAYRGKAGGTDEEWLARMTATTWLTGTQAKDIALVDTLIDPVALSAFAPLKAITAKLKAPKEITALIDSTSPSNVPASQPTIESDMTAEEIQKLVNDGIAAVESKITAAATEKVTALETKLAEAETKLTAQAKELAEVKDLQAKGVVTVTAHAPVCAAGAQGAEGSTLNRKDFGKLSAHEQALFIRNKANKLID